MKKNKKILAFFLFTLLALFITSCKKTKTIKDIKGKWIGKAWNVNLTKNTGFLITLIIEKKKFKFYQEAEKSKLSFIGEGTYSFSNKKFNGIVKKTYEGKYIKGKILAIYKFYGKLEKDKLKGHIENILTYENQPKKSKKTILLFEIKKED